MRNPVLYDRWVFIEAVEHGIFLDVDGFAEGLSSDGTVIDEYIKPSDIDILNKSIKYVRWFKNAA